MRMIHSAWHQNGEIYDILIHASNWFLLLWVRLDHMQSAIHTNIHQMDFIKHYVAASRPKLSIMFTID